MNENRQSIFEWKSEILEYINQMFNLSIGLKLYVQSDKKSGGGGD